MQKEQSLNAYTTAELVQELSSREEVKCHSENEVVLLDITAKERKLQIE